jgi:hypothetical protein
VVGMNGENEQAEYARGGTDERNDSVEVFRWCTA